MKKTIFNTLILLFSVSGLVFSVINYVKGNQKIAYIDVVKILNASPKMKEIEILIKREEKQLKEKSNQLYSELQSEIATVEKSSPNAAVRSEKNTELNKRSQQFQHYAKSEMEKLKQKQLSETQRVLDDVNKLVERYAIEHNYTLVLGAVGNGNIVYGASPADITDEIIKML